MKIGISIVLALGAASCAVPGAPFSPPKLSVLSWNVQNLFDDVYDGREYPEFDPRSRWTRAAYERRCRAFADTIRSLNDGPPDVVALQEVENERVVRFLVERFLGDLGYRWFAVAPPGDSSVRVALISRIPIERTVSARPIPSERSRSLLAGIWTVGTINVCVIVNHWKSRIPDAVSTETERRASARALAELARTIAFEEPRTAILAVGDFNTSLRLSAGFKNPAIARYAAGRELFDTLSVDEADSANRFEDAPAGVWIEPKPRSAENVSGTYVHRRTWYDFDHVFVEARAYRQIRHLDVSIVSSPKLLNAHGEPRGWSPIDPNGVSDHLPVFAVIEW